MSVGAVGVGGGFSVRSAVRVVPAAPAEIVADVDVVTVVVVMVNVALVAPAGTVRLAGTVTAWESSPSDTIEPPLGAAALSVTVPVADSPPITVVGLTDTLDTVGGGGGGLTVSTADFDTPSYVPVIVTDVAAVTAVVDTWKVALDWPAGIVTLVGTVATVLFVDRATGAPPAGAG